MVASKESILEKAKKPQLVFIKSMEDELPLRPLSKKEAVEVEKIESKAYGKFETNEKAKTKRGMRQKKNANVESELETKGTIDLAKMTIASQEGKTMAIFISINNDHPDAEKWTKEEIEGMTNDDFDDVFEAVRELSGIGIEEDEDEEDFQD